MPITPSQSMNEEISMEDFKRWLKSFDANKDGRISKAELREAIRSRGGWFTTWKSGRGLRQADTNRNGYIDDGEIENLIIFAQKNMGMKITT